MRKIAFLLLIAFIIACENDDDNPDVVIKPQINVLIIDADAHGRTVVQVLTNKLQPLDLTAFDTKNKQEVIFDLHEDIKYHVSENYDDFNPNKRPADIVNASFGSHHISNAKNNLAQFLTKEKFPEFPLVVTSAGNTTNTCTQEAYAFAKEHGGLSWFDHLAPHFGCNPNPEESANCERIEEALILDRACNLFVAHVIHERPALAKNLIIVGTSEFSGQKPGPVLKSRWISTYFNFSSTEGSYESGTSFSAPYVVKMAAEIKRRAPHYTNDEIAQLIFSTAHDIGEPGIDEVYGNGVLNPKGIFDELTKRGY